MDRRGFMALFPAGGLLMAQNFGLGAGGQAGDNDSRFRSIERTLRDHLGAERGTSDYPHPSMRVRTLVFGGGFGRLDEDGISLLATDNGVEDYAFISQPIFRDSTAHTVANSTTETDGSSFALPANTLTGARALRLTLGGSIASPLSTDTVTVKVKLGSTTIATISTTGTTVGGFYGILYINLTGASAQIAFGILAGPAATGSWGTTAAENEATALTLKATYQWGAAHADSTITQNYAVLERV